MRLTSFITQGAEVRKILKHIGVDPQAPRITPARGPPRWGACDAQSPEVEGIEPDEDVPSQLAPDDGVDQRTDW